MSSWPAVYITWNATDGRVKWVFLLGACWLASSCHELMARSVHILDWLIVLLIIARQSVIFLHELSLVQDTHVLRPLGACWLASS